MALWVRVELLRNEVMGDGGWGMGGQVGQRLGHTGIRQQRAPPGGNTRPNRHQLHLGATRAGDSGTD